MTPKRIAFLAALPFHEWCMEDLRTACDEAGHTTETFVHRPAHGHDWLSTDGGRRIRDEVAAWRPDLIVLAVRHSLASRGNTYEPEQGPATHLAAFGPLDMALLHTRVLPGSRLIYGGPTVLCSGAPWLDRIRHGDIAAHRQRLRDHHMLDGEKHAVLFAPTWNRWTDVDAVAAWARSRPDLAVFLRPHPATAWRDRDRLEAQGFAGITNSNLHPAEDILGADVVITDVSGIGLMTVCAPDAAIPVVQLEPPAGVYGFTRDAGAARVSSPRSPQIDPDGPEWTERANVGAIAAGHHLSLNVAIDQALTHDPYRDRRRALRGKLMFGAEDSAWHASKKLAEWIGTIGR